MDVPVTALPGAHAPPTAASRDRRRGSRGRRRLRSRRRRDARTPAVLGAGSAPCGPLVRRPDPRGAIRRSWRPRQVERDPAEPHRRCVRRLRPSRPERRPRHLGDGGPVDAVGQSTRGPRRTRAPPTDRRGGDDRSRPLQAAQRHPRSRGRGRRPPCVRWGRVLRRPSERHGRPLGGEEIALLLSDATVEEACAVVERLRERWASVRPYPVTFSAGVARVGRRGGHDALRAADAAMYEAKAAGRDQIVVARA